MKLEEQASHNFINLPIEFQLRGYDYEFISKSYLNFFNSEDNSRQDKLVLAKKFLKFIRSVNKNRAREELGESFFMCFQYFMENFSDLVAKQDMIHLDALSVITEAIDKSQFIEDIISIDELKRRVSNLEVVAKKEEIIQAEWDEVQCEYTQLNSNRVQQEVLLLNKETNEDRTTREDSE